MLARSTPITDIFAKYRSLLEFPALLSNLKALG